MIQLGNDIYLFKSLIIEVMKRKGDGSPLEWVDELIY